MKVLVTGGAGYIGTEIVRRLTQLDAVSNVVVYDNFSAGKQGMLHNGINRSKLHIVKADILDSRTLSKEISESNLVIHAAGIGSPYNSNDFDIHQLEQVNHWGTAELVRTLEAYAPKAYLVYLSSVEVAGATNHTSAYASSIARAEEEIERLVSKKSATILRLADVFGSSANLRTDTLLNQIATDALLFGKIRILGDGNQTFAFSSIDDVTNAAMAAVSNELPAGTFNLKSHNLTLNMLAEELSIHMPQPEAIYVAHHFEMSRSNAENDLPPMSQSSSFSNTLKVFLQNLMD